MFMVSSGFSLSLHYCEGELENWSFIGDSDSCDHNHEEEKSCHEEEIEPKSCCTKNDNETTVRDNCCKSSTKTALLKENFNLSSINFSLPAVITLYSLFVSSQHLTNNVSVESYYKKSKENPPILIEDIPIHIQSFLI